MPATVLSVVMVVSVFGQSNPIMSAAGDPMKQAGYDSPGATTHAYEGAAPVQRGTKITAKVKTALHERAPPSIPIPTSTPRPVFSACRLKCSIMNSSPRIGLDHA